MQIVNWFLVRNQINLNFSFSQPSSCLYVDNILPEHGDPQSPNGAVEDADVDEILEHEARRRAQAHPGQAQYDNLGAKEANHF